VVFEWRWEASVWIEATLANVTERPLGDIQKLELEARKLPLERYDKSVIPR
jgi:hypothetical protein